MAQLTRGIAPERLLSQVKNTMPYLFSDGTTGAAASLAPLDPAQAVLEYARHESAPLDHAGYFRLCTSAHFLTCATPVPTDVDNQIRHKLWPAQLPLATALEMSAFVLGIRAWDLPRLSTRYVYGANGTPWQGETVSGHLGEWFTVAAAAYCALKQYREPAAESRRAELFAAIEDEVNRHSEIFGSLWKSGDGLGALRAAATLAHNFGDLDRVMDMWSLGIEDPLRLRFYKLTATPFDPEGKLRYLGRLWSAGELYKAELAVGSMSFENHRYFALRKPRALRASRDYLIPIGPFFDEWGMRVARGLTSADGTPSADTREVVDALRYGWEKLPNTVGYGRALRSLFEVHPELRAEAPELFKQHRTRVILEMPCDQFESLWRDAALRELDEIPSRA